MRHRARLQAVAVGFLGHGPDAADAVQDAMVITIRKIGDVAFRIIPGRHVAITELLLVNPRDKPLHCPPAVIQVHFHRAGRTHRLVSHYAQRS